MAQHVWMVHVETYELRLMYAVDAQEAVRIGDYAYAPVGGYAPPPAQQPREEPPRTVAA
jgi:hypothetical protein